MRASSVRNGGVIGGERSVAIALSLMLLISGLFLGACFNPSYEAPRCSPLGECPSGLTCVAEVCVKDPSIGAGDPDAGQQPDSGPQPADARPIDAPPPISTAPSCAGGGQNRCGRNGDEDCCATAMVPGGNYNRQFDVAGDGQYTSLGFPATISSFRLDKYEVTVGRFRAYVAAMRGTQENPPVAGSGAHAALPDSGWLAAWNANLPANQAALLTSLNCSLGTWTNSPGANENKPVNCINWYQAMAFCIWDGGYLPTEAEWHYASSGGNEQRAYPWSVPPSSLLFDERYASFLCMLDGIAGCTLADIAAAGSLYRGNGRWGHADLGGSLHEWVLDSSSSYPVPCNNCAAPHGPTMLIRGGSFDRLSSDMRSSYRLATNGISRIYFVGARCARPAN